MVQRKKLPEVGAVSALTCRFYFDWQW